VNQEEANDVLGEELFIQILNLERRGHRKSILIAANMTGKF